MSFILEALRKSESDRQQQAAPTLAGTRYDVAQKRTSKWVPILVLILCVNAAIIVLAVLKNSNSPDAVSHDPDVAEPELTLPRQRNAAKPAAQPIEKLASERVRSLAKETGQPDSAPALTATEVSADPLLVTPEIRKPAPNSDTEKIGALNEGLPGLQQLVLAGVISLPPLHLDMHVYSPDRARRFVFINMRKYKERTQIEEGPMVEEVTETGVVLSYQGNRFFLDRE
jgi:general secretion pathway protein B